MVKLRYCTCPVAPWSSGNISHRECDLYGCCKKKKERKTRIKALTCGNIHVIHIILEALYELLAPQFSCFGWCWCLVICMGLCGCIKMYVSLNSEAVKNSICKKWFKKLSCADWISQCTQSFSSCEPTFSRTVSGFFFRMLGLEIVWWNREKKI